MGSRQAIDPPVVVDGREPPAAAAARGVAAGSIWSAARDALDRAPAATAASSTAAPCPDLSGRSSFCTLRGRVSLDEYIASHDGLLADKETFLAGMAVVVDRFFVIGDRDRDGHIVEREYAMHVAPFGVSAEEARGSFERLDRDGDGKISRDEMLKNLEEFYFSDDPDARGNWVLGPLRT